MDYHALQQKLFEMDPADPADDIRKITEMASGSETPVTESFVDGHGDVHDIPQGSAPIDKDYSISDFAKLAGVQINENKGDSFGKGLARKVAGDDGIAAFDAGYKNYNKMNVLKKGADAALDTMPKDKKAVPTTKALAGQEYKELLKQHSVKLQKIAANPTRKAQFDKFMASISEAELEAKKPKPMKARDPNAQYMNDLRKSGAAGSHKDKTKTIPRKQKYKDTNESIKSQLWAALNSKK